MRVATRSVVLPLPRKSTPSLRAASTILDLARLRDETSHKRVSHYPQKPVATHLPEMSAPRDLVPGSCSTSLHHFGLMQICDFGQHIAGSQCQVAERP